MAVYRFRVSFEDYDEVIREIDLKSGQSFYEFHRIIHQNTGYPVECSSSFYVSNDHWYKGQEIAYLPTRKKIDDGVILMEQAKLVAFIDDPHQKFYYTYNFDRPYYFQIELIKILEEDVTANYPIVSKQIGEAPKLVVLPPVATDELGLLALDDESDDLLFDPNELDDAAELDLITRTALSLDEDDSEQGHEGEHDDEFSTEFSDENEQESSDDYSKDDDY